VRQLRARRLEQALTMSVRSPAAICPRAQAAASAGIGRFHSSHRASSPRASVKPK
jgi:hypothetical protein